MKTIVLLSLCSLLAACATPAAKEGPGTPQYTDSDRRLWKDTKDFGPVHNTALGEKTCADREFGGVIGQHSRGKYSDGKDIGMPTFWCQHDRFAYSNDKA